MVLDPEVDDARIEIYSDNISEELWEMNTDPELESPVSCVLERALEKHIEALEERLNPIKELYKLLQQTKN